MKKDYLEETRDNKTLRWYRFPRTRLEHARTLAMLLSIQLDDSHFVMWYQHNATEKKGDLWVGPLAAPGRKNHASVFVNEHYVQGARSQISGSLDFLLVK